MRIGFRFRLVPCIATVLVVALGISLGNWQQRRAEQKTALQHKLAEGNAAAPLGLSTGGAAALPLDAAAAAAIEYRRVRLTGEFRRDWPLYLDNRPYQGRAGFYLLMPFRMAGSDVHVLVERGWLPRNMAQREQMQPYATPAGQVTLEGVVKLSAGHVMQLGNAAPLAPGAIVQNVEPAQLAAAGAMVVQPFVVEQSGPAVPLASLDSAQPAAGDDAKLVRDWPAPALGVEKHRGYAFQWYALALMAVLFFVSTGFRRGK
ncbi:SURF1 family protein [Rugamonas rubra]|uniref:SURF1-like protein n=1 Tax=Rugamonas rubra TaxID=758825 RepID=A0A1I4N048_9BURK|nr:SURF1 family protein [Rugamonas rubra]SFM08580.1 Cytochrome oxidase assembly protein ShyY1 [Rugamonas rubra]